jgi:hypothetical protein
MFSLVSIIEDATTHQTSSEIVHDIALQNMLFEISAKLARHSKIALHCEILTDFYTNFPLLILYFDILTIQS